MSIRKKMEMDLAEEFRLTGSTTVVTGGGSGIGWETAVVFADSGAHAPVSDLDDGGAAETAAEIVEEGGQAVARRVDVSDPAAVTQLVADAETGRLDVMVNNEGRDTP
ncbi:SDR family NAD(P)-dependent oxidoreductase [Streptomyces sp. NPDC058694]|uniref:SDR family NAD(P)-dependent oxidoreductase n=1 Tax=Streptomyces sp. NPDC058694 TaxID=3346603 RepID=UPI003669B8A6